MEENKMKNIIKNIVSAKKEKNTQKLPMFPNVKKGFRRYCAMVETATICSSMVLTASATGGDPLTVVNNLSDFIFGMITNSLSIGGFKRITGKYVQLDDGQFEVTLIRRPTNPVELNTIMAALLNRNINTDLMYCFKASSLKVTSDVEIAWTLDGEYGGKHNEAVIQVNKQALQIRVPK